jgi:hypothetical protein
MTESQKDIYISIRAEQIKHFQDTRNGHLFINPYSIEKAKEIAKNQLEYDLERGKLRISLEDLLLEDNETCIRVVRNETVNTAKELVK